MKGSATVFHCTAVALGILFLFYETGPLTLALTSFELNMLTRLPLERTRDLFASAFASKRLEIKGMCP